MKTLIFFLSAVSLFAQGGFTHGEPADFNDHDGWISLFDGQSLKGWDGDTNYWQIKDGAIYVAASCEKPTGTIYLVWQGGEAADFQLKMEMKGTGAINGGVQYRGWIMPPPANAAAPAAAAGRGNATPCPSGQPRGAAPTRASQAKWEMGGPQYDFDNNNRYPGQFYEQSTGRGIIAWKGEAVETYEGKPKRLLSVLADKPTVDSWFKKDDWNQLEIIAVGNQSTHLLNGHVASILVDNEKSKFHAKGLIGVEVESTGELFIKNIWLKRLN